MFFSKISEIHFEMAERKVGVGWRSTFRSCFSLGVCLQSFQDESEHSVQDSQVGMLANSTYKPMSFKEDSPRHFSGVSALCVWNCSALSSGVISGDGSGG